MEGSAGAGGIRVVGVSYAYGPSDKVRPALAQTTFEVAPGELVALIGANGTGKSTLLKLLAGLIAPSAGSISIGGAAPSPGRHAVGLVFQEPRLVPWRSVIDNVAFPLELAGASREQRHRRGTELLGLVDLRLVAHVRPHQLSGGQRQRVAIARALAADPGVLLLDEPFSALDAFTRERLNEELQELWLTTSATVVCVTHSVSEAIFLADRVLVLAGHPGRLVADIEVGLPRPRRLADLDAATVSDLARRIRDALSEGDDDAARLDLGGDAEEHAS